MRTIEGVNASNDSLRYAELIDGLHDFPIADSKEKDNSVEMDENEVENKISTLTEPPNGGYGWVIVVSSFFVHVFVLGNVYSFGVFYPIYIDTFQASPADVAWVGSVGFFMLAGLGAYAGKWADRFGNGLVVFVGGLFIAAGYFAGSYSTELWQLYLTHGFLAGIGYCLSFIAGVSVISQWFSSRRGFAVGLAVAGSGVGQFCLSIITRILIDNDGWRIALRYLALISIVGLSICAIFIRPLVPYVHNNHTESALKLFYQWNFSALYIGALFSSLGLIMPFTHLPLYAIQHGISYSNASLLLSYMGIASAIGRVALGYAADNVGKLSMLFLCTLGGAISTFCWMACVSYPALITYAVFYGFFAGGIISLMPAVSAELFGVQKLGSILGLLYTSTALGNLLSAPIGGYLFGVYHSYYLSIAVAGGFMSLALVFLSVIRPASTEIASPCATEDEFAISANEERIDGDCTIELAVQDLKIV